MPRFVTALVVEIEDDSFARADERARALRVLVESGAGVRCVEQIETMPRTDAGSAWCDVADQLPIGRGDC